MSLELDPAREQAELEQYLGAGFDLGRLRAYEHELEREYAACGDEQRFYRTSEAYLYDLTAFAMTATKLPYLHDLPGLVLPGARVLDYGCGIGSDGLLLAEAGYRVEFADFDNPSVAFLRCGSSAVGSRRRSTISTARFQAASTPPTPST